MVPLSKSGVRKHRGFESHPLRQALTSGMGHPGVGSSAPSLTHHRVRSLGCSAPPRADLIREARERVPDRAVGAGRGTRRGRLVDYGAALEMRFGETRRGFESLPLRHSLASSAGSGLAERIGRRRTLGRAGEYRYTLSCRARRGTSGALYLQSAPAGLNSPSRPPCAEAAIPGDVEDRVPRSGDSRTVSDPEGSSTQRSSPGAAERPGPSRLRWWARARVGRRGVHGTFVHAAHSPGRVDRGSPGAP